MNDKQAGDLIDFMLHLIEPMCRQDLERVKPMNERLQKLEKTEKLLRELILCHIELSEYETARSLAVLGTELVNEIHKQKDKQVMPGVKHLNISHAIDRLAVNCSIITQIGYGPDVDSKMTYSMVMKHPTYGEKFARGNCMMDCFLNVVKKFDTTALNLAMATEINSAMTDVG